MKPIFIKSILMAALAAVVPVHSVASAASSTDIEDVTAVTTTDYVEDDAENSITYESTCEFSIDDNNLCTLTTIDEDGIEKTYTFQLDEDGNGEFRIDDQVFIVSEYCNTDDESEVYSEHKPGDDPSEVFGLREYIDGDKLNRIHWKLTSKKNKFIVKDYSLPVDVPSTVFLDLKCYEDSDSTLAVFDTLIDTALSVSQFLINNERMHNLIYYNGKKNCFVQRCIKDASDLSDLVGEIVTSFNDNLFCRKPEEFFADNDLSASSFTFISSTSDNNILSFICDEIDADFRNAMIVVKSNAEGERIKVVDEKMTVVPVVVGGISASVKDIVI